MADGRDEPDTAELLSRIARGEQAALDTFYRAHHRRIYAFILRRLDDPADAADVLHEVMLEVWRHAGRYGGRSAPLTWVLGIANNRLRDRLRQRGRRHTEPLDEEPAADEPGVGDALAGAQDAERLRHCLTRLSPDHRQVVHLTFYEELSYPEIAGILDCPVGTVKTRMFHARRALKRCLSRFGVGRDGSEP